MSPLNHLIVRGTDPWKVLFRQTAEPGRTSFDAGLVTKLGGSKEGVIRQNFKELNGAIEGKKA